MVDQAKAFDRVSHDWLDKVIVTSYLEMFARNLISILYSEAKSKLLIDHTLSDTIYIQRGVRQGDPLSPILYILSIEPLLTCIRSDTDIPAVFRPGGMERKLVGYADNAKKFINKTSIPRIVFFFFFFYKSQWILNKCRYFTFTL